MTAPQTTILFVAHRPALIEHAVRVLGSRAQAEDVVQEAWVRFDAAVRRQAIDEPLAYLYRIVRNLALDRRGANARERCLFVAAADDEIARSSMRCAIPTPEGIALYRDELRQLRDAMRALPERTRLAFQMRRVGGCKLREIADRLNVSVPFAHALVADGLERCRQQLRRPPAPR